MKIDTYTPTDYFGSNMYVISHNGEVAVIDPSVSYSTVCDKLLGEVKFVILSHAHFDHFAEIDSWVENTAAKVMVGRADAPALQDSNLNCYRNFLGIDKGYFGRYNIISENDKIQLSDKQITFIEAPGHSEGSVVTLIDDCMFVGDVLFYGGGYGRVDLPGGDFAKLKNSIKKVLSYPEDSVVYSGHGPSTTIKELKRYFI